MNTHDQLQENLKGEFVTSGGGHKFKKIAPHIKCRKGLILSVQASKGHYCTPRQDAGPYNAVEIGFPSRRLVSLMQYAEDKKRLTKTVYGWVPIEKVVKIIDEWGGIENLLKR